MSKKKKARKKARKHLRKNALTFANDMLVRYSSIEPHVTLKTMCLECNAEMHGDWHGKPPYTLACPMCPAVYTVTTV